MYSSGMSEILEIFRDKNIAAIVKPAGIDSETDIPALLREKTGGVVYCVHRLDKAVGGVMLYARSKRAAAEISSKISSKDGFKKEYIAIVPDSVELPDCGVMKDLLFHDSRCNKTFVVNRERKGVKEAELEYTVLERRNDLALVRILLKTGRSHQIRVQFASRGLPLVGDKKYGSRVEAGNIALWSSRITCKDIFGKEQISFSAAPGVYFPWSEFDITGEYPEN